MQYIYIHIYTYNYIDRPITNTTHFGLIGVVWVFEIFLLYISRSVGFVLSIIYRCIAFNV